MCPTFNVNGFKTQLYLYSTRKSIFTNFNMSKIVSNYLIVYNTNKMLLKSS